MEAIFCAVFGQSRKSVGTLAIFIHYIHALGDFAESGVGAVQMRSGFVHDEELASGGIRMHGPGHGKHAFCMRQVIPEAVLGEFSPDGIAGSAGSGSFGAASLNHESGNDPVERQPVIETFLNQADEVVDRIRRDLRIELGLHDITVFHGDGDNRICHF